MTKIKRTICAALAAAILAASLLALTACGETENGNVTALRETFLAKANEVVVTDDAVTFSDASDAGTVTVAKNPGKVAVLYASFTTLWYEAGGTAQGVIGGSSSVELYEEYIGRDITQDDGVQVLATSGSGKNWSTETIVDFQPDLIICSTAMSGYSTIKAPAAAAGIPVVAVEYNDFSDYLKWFKVFCNLTGSEELWTTVAEKALDDVLDVVAKVPEEGAPEVFSMFIGASSIQANTGNTVLGGMISQLGATNIVDAWNGASSAERLDINLETVYAADPDIILAQCHSDEDTCKGMVTEQYGDNAVWNSLSAVKDDKVYYLQKTLFHNKPNSRFADAYRTLAEILYPDVEF